MNDSVKKLLEAYVEHHVTHGTRLDPRQLCAGQPELLEPLLECIRRYDDLERTLAAPDNCAASEATGNGKPFPVFEGFRTVERLGTGGGGDVYKLVDLELGRTVAGKVIRSDNPLHTTVDDFLREARTMALFADPRIVRILEFRRTSDPPVLLMEHVEGFALHRVARSLEHPQRARIVAEIADAIQHAHTLGVQHRDLKPSNILLDADLRPRILDFGLSRGEPNVGHGVGTPSYMAPEQFDRSRAIDERSDVYALGVILYELLCGSLPYPVADDETQADAARRGRPRLPVEIQPDVPEPLQAIALKAMEPDPETRYGSAREMGEELRRFLEGRPVLARPTAYRNALHDRLRDHLEQIREWLGLKLIYPHEANRLLGEYRRLEQREDDWIVQSRVLSLSQIALYLGAFLLVCGSLLYFVADLTEAVDGIVGPILVLGLPFAGLNVAAHLLFRVNRRAVAVAFHLAAVVLLPVLLLIVFREASIFPPAGESVRELLGDYGVSNRQLQIAALIACAWSCWLAVRTRTVGLSVSFVALAFVFYLTVLSDLGLRSWLEENRWDLLALHLVPFLFVAALGGALAERRERPWFAKPLYVGSILLYVAVLELLALHGRAFHYLGLSLAPFQRAGVSDPLLLDTLAAMTLNGVLFYIAARLLERFGTPLLRPTSWLLYTISPFAILEPIAWLAHVGEYSRRFDWLYLGLALAIAWISHLRQRKSFYFAGLINTGIALWLITQHNEWFDRPAWAVSVVAVGLGVLGLGFALAARERDRRVRPHTGD